jgi:hypothetical protein
MELEECPERFNKCFRIFSMGEQTKEYYKSFLKDTVKMERKTFQKTIFIMNALENGWNVKKKGTKYIFTKKHENKKEIFQEEFLQKFIEKNIFEI